MLSKSRFDELRLNSRFNLCCGKIFTFDVGENIAKPVFGSKQSE